MACSQKTVFISGLCQSRKTQKTLDVLASLTCPEVPTLLLYITQAGSTLNAFQVIQRLRSHPVLGRAFPCIERAAAAKPAAPNHTQTRAIVDFYHKKNMHSMLKVASASHFQHVMCIIDEADQGALTGFKGRLTVLRQLADVLSSDCHLHSIFVTATVPNLCKLFVASGGAQAQAQAQDAPPGARTRAAAAPPAPTTAHHLFVTPAPTYVSMEWFRANGRIRIVPGVNDLLETAAVKKRLNKDAAFTHLEGLTNDQRRLVLLSCTNAKSEQSKMAEQLVDGGSFDLAVCLNSENAKNYVVHYHGGSWAIPYGTMMRAATQGKLAKYVTDRGHMIDTGVDSAHDISLSQVLFTGMLTNADFTAALKRTPDDMRPQLVTLRNFLANKRPEDYPRRARARMAIIGGNMLSRGITIQDPIIGFTCSAFLFLDSGRGSADAGASHTQKAGRALGNMMPIFEGGSVGGPAEGGPDSSPIMVISAPLLVSALSNERLTYVKGRAHDGAVINVNEYITGDEYREMVKVVRRELE